MSHSESDDAPLKEMPSAKKQRYLTFSERYFTPLYKLKSQDESKSGVDEPLDSFTSDSSKEATPTTSSSNDDSPVALYHVKVLLHSNGICVVTLAPSHPILTKKLKVDKIDFQVSKRVNRLDNAVKGKAKKGGQFFADDKQRVAFVSCTDGSVFPISNGVRGALIEVNDRLVNQPELLTSDPFGQGFLAIILPRKGERDAQKLNLLTEEEYFAEMRKMDVRT